MPYCPECGASVTSDDIYCHSCGYRLSHDRDPQQEEHGSPPQDGRRIDQSRGPSDYRESEQPDYRESEHPDYRGPEHPGYGGPEQPNHRGRERGGYHHDEYQHGYSEQGARQSSGPRVEDGKVSYAFKLPTSDGYGALVLGALCVAGSFLLIPAILLLGYAYRLTEAAAYGDRLQPPFEDVGDLLVKGVGYLVVYIVLTILTYAVAFIFLGTASLSADAQPVFASLSGVLYLVSVLGLSYVMPAVYVIYAASGSLTSGFSPRRIAEFAFTGTYLVAFLIYLVVSILLFVTGLVLGFVLFFTIIGPFIFFPVFFAFYLYFIAAFWGGTYYEAVQEGIVPHPSEYDDQESQEYVTDQQY